MWWDDFQTLTDDLIQSLLTEFFNIFSLHGIPHKDHILHEGDIVSLDAGLIYKGYQPAAAKMQQEIAKLIQTEIIIRVSINNT